MRKLDDTLKALLLSGPVQKSHISEEEACFSKPLSCPLFEAGLSEGLASQMPLQWQFATPMTHERHQFNFGRQLTHFDLNILRNDENLSSELETFSMDMTQRREDAPSGRNLEDTLIYVAVIEKLCRLFENSVMRFTYSVPSPVDDDLLFADDSFQFESLTMKVVLLGHIFERANKRDIRIEDDLSLDTSYFINRSQDYGLAADILNEIQLQRRLLVEKAPSTRLEKFTYCASPQNMSSATSITSNELSQRKATTSQVALFARNFLGTGYSEQARVHLCLARKAEMCFHDWSYNIVRKSSRDQSGYEGRQTLREMIGPVMQAIINQYDMVNSLTLASPQDRTLYEHSKFMSHLWFVRMHGLVATWESGPLMIARGGSCTSLGVPIFSLLTLSSTEVSSSQIDSNSLELAERALLRLSHVVRRHEAMVKSKNPPRLQRETREAYDQAYNQAKALYDDLHQFLVKDLNRSVVTTLEIPAEEDQEIFDYSKGKLRAMLESAYNSNECHYLRQTVVNLEKLHSKFFKSPGRSISVTASRIDERERQAFSSDVKIGDSATYTDEMRRAVLLERLMWLRWLTENAYLKEKSEFIIDPSRYHEFMRQSEEITLVFSGSI